MNYRRTQRNQLTWEDHHSKHLEYEIKPCGGTLKAQAVWNHWTMDGSADLFKEFSVLFMTVAMLHQNPYVMSKGKGSLLIAEFEGH